MLLYDLGKRLVAVDDPGAASNNVRCFIAVFGHGPGLPETIERVRRVLAVGTPDRLSRHIAVQAAPSSDPDADTAGTLYVNWLFKPGTPDEVIEDIYIHTLTLAIFAAVSEGAGARRRRAAFSVVHHQGVIIMTSWS